MHDPQRTGAAKAGELQPGGRMPFGDIAGHIDAAEKERDTALAWALQGGEAMAGLFKADAKLLPQTVNVMPHLPRPLSKASIGHEEGTGRIVGEADEQQLPCPGAAEVAGFNDALDDAIEGESGQLVGQLETAALSGLALIDHQMPHRRVIISQALAILIDQRDRQAVAQMPFERRDIG
jgi:hypothetical protein